MRGDRFTAYLGATEMKKLRELAESEGTSMNYLVRTAVRALLGYPAPRWVAELMREALK